MAEHHGSENRQRQKQVAVRLNDAEYALLQAETERTGWSEAKVLRSAFLTSVLMPGSIPDEDMVTVEGTEKNGLDTWDF